MPLGQEASRALVVNLQCAKASRLRVNFLAAVKSSSKDFQTRQTSQNKTA